MTNIVPGIQVVDKDRAVETTLNANITGGLFVNNPDLDYAAAQASATFKLDGLVGRLIPGLKLQVSDAFIVSPEAPSFVTAGTPVTTENVFARGIVPVRANTLSNSAIVAASYPLSKSLNLDGTYGYSLYRVGKIYVEESVPVVFFNTDFQRATIGPTYNLARGDKIGLDYGYATGRFTEKSANVTTTSGVQTVVAHSLEAHYGTGGSDWGLYASGGATVTEGGNPFFSGKLTLSKAFGTTTSVAVNASRQAAPAFFGTAGLLISNNAGVAIARRFAESLSLTATANYARNEGTAGNPFLFESIAASGVLDYYYSKSTVASLSYQYMHFQTHFESGVPGSESIGNRSIAMLTIKWLWK